MGVETTVAGAHARQLLHMHKISMVSKNLINHSLANLQFRHIVTLMLGALPILCMYIYIHLVIHMRSYKTIPITIINFG